MTDIDPIEYGTYIERVDNLVKRIAAIEAHPMLTADVAAWAVVAQQKAAKRDTKAATRSQVMRTVLLAPVGSLAGFLVAQLVPHIHL